MSGFRECSAEQGFTCLALPLKTAIMRPFRFPEMSPMPSICNQTCVLVKHQALLVIFVPQLSVLRLFLCRRPRWDKGLKPPYFRFSLRPVSSVLLLGCLKYPGQDALMQPWFRNCSRFMCLALGYTAPQSTHPGLSPSLPFSLPHLHAAPCLQSPTHTQGPQLLAQFPSKISYVEGLWPLFPWVHHQESPATTSFMEIFNSSVSILGPPLTHCAKF